MVLSDLGASGMALRDRTVHTPGADHERTSAVDRPDKDVVQGGTRSEQLLTPGQVARLFGVDPKTVSRWADAGKLVAMRTLGGHRRYRAREVEALLGDVSS